jgi:glycosyltransferase involved in cell wall biosynthesis
MAPSGGRHPATGGPLEFVTDGVTGYVAEPDPKAIAETFDRLVADAALAERLAGRERARPRGRADLVAVVARLLD